MNYKVIRIIGVVLLVLDAAVTILGLVEGGSQSLKRSARVGRRF